MRSGLWPLAPMPDPPPHQHAHTVAFVCGAEILCLTSFSLVPALLPQFIVSWSLSNAEAGWLAGIMSAGYMVAVLPLVALTDRMPARTIFLASGLLNALSCFGIAFSDGLLPALIWRALSGIAVAGMYMPGLRALTDGMAGATRARAAAWYTSSFTLGSSLSFLLGQPTLGFAAATGLRKAATRPNSPPVSFIPGGIARYTAIGPVGCGHGIERVVALDPLIFASATGPFKGAGTADADTGGARPLERKVGFIPIQIGQCALAGKGCLFVSNIDLLPCWTEYPGAIKQTFFFVVEEGARELTNPIQMVLAKFIRLAGTNVSYLSDRFPIFCLCRHINQSNRKCSDRQQPYCSCAFHHVPPH
jgi:MFS family permease